MPEMTVWFVSLSLFTRKVGSSSERAARALDSLSWSSLVAGLDGHGDDRLGEDHLLQDDRGVDGRERVAGGGVLQADEGDDVAGLDLGDVLPAVGVHLEDAADPVLAALGGVEDGVAGVELAGVHPDVGQAAHVGVGLDLEHHAREGLVVLGVADDGLAGRGLAGDGGDVGRGREEVDDGVEQGLHALVLEGAAAEDGDDLAHDHAGAQPGQDLLGGEVVVLEVVVEQLLGGLGHGLHQGWWAAWARSSMSAGISWCVKSMPVGAVPHEGGHGDEVDDADELVLGADGQLDGDGGDAEAGAQHLEAAVEVRAHPVHLVDEDDAGHAVLVGLAPDGLGLGLDAGHGVEDGHRAVEHPQRALHLDGEVDVAGGVDQLDGVAPPLGGGGGGGDGDPPLLLLLHPVHGGGAVVDLADLVAAAGVEQDALGRRGLPRVDVRHDPDVAGLGQAGGGRAHGPPAVARLLVAAGQCW